ncbi:glycoside hydrolase family 36 protein [Cohnella fermenti]|uniref:Alpha-galactosidase n=1 Tax=Cohnella fermenti TaxID=2565925 RepID=A0A4V3WGL4_9BACL|nr:glycoside hydrolase family 36 protein [Cohnella fermenti]THF84646.1 alpha-galactosidase [Cohnella fermenti]
MSISTQWLEQRLSKGEEAPFSFQYGSAASAEWLSGADRRHEVSEPDEHRRIHKLVYSKELLSVECVAVEYVDYPIVEWTVYLQNIGTQPSPILENLQALDAVFAGEAEREITLMSQRGSEHSVRDFEFYEERLEHGAGRVIASVGGRPSNGHLPYLRLNASNIGISLAIGWPGQWAASFSRCEGEVRVRAGQERVRLRLLPGERIRTPLIAIQFWQGDSVEAQNVYRRWMNEHNAPRPHGRQLSPFVAACSSHQFSEMEKADEDNQKLFINRYLEEGVPLDYWWMDAGWYPNRGSWVNTGTWEVDRMRFPRGLKAVTESGHKRGVGSIVWFEPERVTTGSSLTEAHPDWLLSPPETIPQGHNAFPNWRLLDLGNEEARRWWTDWVVRFIEEEGIDIYRQDFNIDPLSYWRENDEEDRQGMTEIRYVEGLLAFFDELRERRGGILIDTCASGGRRLDLESMRRAVPLTRSDYHFEPVGQQCQTYGLSPWLTFHGGGIMHTEPHRFRSAIAPCNILCFDMRETSIDYETLRRNVQERARLVPYYKESFYPLTPFSVEEDVWMAWQFHREADGSGIALGFRRQRSEEESLSVRLRGIDASAEYELTITDERHRCEKRRLSGRTLSEQGILLQERTKGASLAIHYEIIKGADTGCEE